jgi:hypothetical protein
MQNRELKRKSSVLAQKCLKEASVSITDIADEADTAASADGELDNLMRTIKGVFNFFLILFLVTHRINSKHSHQQLILFPFEDCCLLGCSTV